MPHERHHILNLERNIRMVDALQNEFGRASSASLTVSFVRASGLQLLLNNIKDFLHRGGNLRVISSTYLCVTDPASLRSLNAIIPGRVRVQQSRLGFHAKTYLFRGAGYQRVYIGSSNWTKGGIADNLEWNSATGDEEVVDEAEALFEKLWGRSDVFEANESFIARYEKARNQRGPATFSQSVFDPMQLEVPDSFSAFGMVDTGAPEPRPDQREALDRLKEMQKSGCRRAAVIAATGIGKTLLMAFFAKETKAGTVLFVAHRKEILEQAQRAFRSVFGRYIQSALLVEGETYHGEEFVFATVQTLSRRRALGTCPELFTRRHDLVVIDEFHHADAPSYRKLITALDFHFLVGLTATPERADGHDVLELCDFNVAYELRLPEAIRRQLLLPFHYFSIADDLVDYARIPWRNGGFEPAALENALIVDERVDAMLKHATEKGYDGQKRVAIGFCAGVKHAIFMSTALEARGIAAVSVDGSHSLEYRRGIYARLQDPRDTLSWLFVSDVLNEGVDLPAINTVVFLRPTESAGLFLQQLGRGLRLTPGTEVLTVLDFVGHHKNAFISLSALQDRTALPTERDAANFGYRPPERCEFMLDDRTREILALVSALPRTKKIVHQEAYETLRNELGRAPEPLDTWERTPSFRDYRSAFGTWHDLRAALGDAEPWERAVEKGGPVWKLLKRAESDWQEPRVTAYAALWAAMESPNDLMAGFNRFFQVHPQWQCERPPKVTDETLNKKLHDCVKPLWTNGAWIQPVQEALQNRELCDAVIARLSVTVAGDFKLRHCGILRTPEELRLFAEYSRPQIINYFGQQFDPQRHNTGVIKFASNELVLITKIDTAGAMERFQYTNRFVDERHFSWSSQNRMRQDNEAGRSITKHELRGIKVHLFVSAGSHRPNVYLGSVRATVVEGNAPMLVTFELPERVPAAVRAELDRKKT